MSVSVYDKDAERADRLMENFDHLPPGDKMRSLNILSIIAGNFESVAGEIRMFIEDRENEMMDKGEI